jgi:hypothetical protein
MAEKNTDQRKAKIKDEINRIGKELNFTIIPMRSSGFKVIAEGQALENKKIEFFVMLPMSRYVAVMEGGKIDKIDRKAFDPKYREEPHPRFMILASGDEGLSPVRGSGDKLEAVPGYALISMTIEEYHLPPEEHTALLKFWYPNKSGGKAKRYAPDIENPYIQPKDGACEYFKNILTGILEDVRYVVTIEIPPDYYFPSPTGAGLVAPVFAMGLQKDIKPIDSQDGYETVLTYLVFDRIF